MGALKELPFYFFFKNFSSFPQQFTKTHDHFIYCNIRCHFYSERTAGEDIGFCRDPEWIYTSIFPGHYIDGCISKSDCTGISSSLVDDGFWQPGCDSNLMDEYSYSRKIFNRQLIKLLLLWTQLFSQLNIFEFLLVISDDQGHSLVPAFIVA